MGLGFYPYTARAQLAPVKNVVGKSKGIFSLQFYAVFTDRFTFSFINLKHSCTPRTWYFHRTTVSVKQGEVCGNFGRM